MWPISQRGGFTSAPSRKALLRASRCAYIASVYSRASTSAARARPRSAALCTSRAPTVADVRADRHSARPRHPFAAGANNGNWRTASRWARLLAPAYRSLLQTPDAPVTGDGRDACGADDRAARARSRPAIEAWTRHRPRRPLVVALTGTDLYRDVAHADAGRVRSLDDADALIVLQETRSMPCPSTCAPRPTWFPVARSLVAVRRQVAAPLDAVLSPPAGGEGPAHRVEAGGSFPVAARAARDHRRAARPALAAEARALADADRACATGPRPHAWTRQAIRRATC